MPTVTPDDVAATIRSQWAAASSLVAIIPVAKVYRGRAPENTAYPYARFRVTEQPTEWTSGSSYLTNFRLEIDCYANDQPPAAGALRKALDAAFAGSSTDPANGMVVTDGTVLHSLPQAGGVSRPTNDRKDGKDVVTTTASYLILVEGSRG